MPCICYGSLLAWEVNPHWEGGRKICGYEQDLDLKISRKIAMDALDSEMVVIFKTACGFEDMERFVSHAVVAVWDRLLEFYSASITLEVIQVLKG